MAKAAGNFPNHNNSVCIGKQQLLTKATIPENWNPAHDLEMGAKSGQEAKTLALYLFFQRGVPGNVSQNWEELCTKINSESEYKVRHAGIQKE